MRATHRQLPVIVIWNIPNCSPIAANPCVLAGPLRADAEGEQSAEQTKSFECGVDSKTKRVAFFSPNTSTDFKACARQVDGKRSDRALFSRKTHFPLTPPSPHFKDYFPAPFNKLLGLIVSQSKTAPCGSVSPCTLLCTRTCFMHCERVLNQGCDSPCSLDPEFVRGGYFFCRPRRQSFKYGRNVVLSNLHHLLMLFPFSGSVRRLNGGCFN